MDKFIINGGKSLYGVEKMPCAKNAYLPILAATILCDGVITLHNNPDYTDIQNMCAVLRNLGAEIKNENEDLIIDSSKINNHYIPHELSGLIRSSIFSLGSILGRFKKAKVAYPGGCEIGTRPIDLHIKGLEALNVKIVDRHGYLDCDGSDMRGAVVNLDFPSVGATENIMLAAVLTKGETKIINCAKEPEIVDLQNFLNKMGAKILGAGTSVITITGVDKLHEIEYTPIPDRIITGTYIIACAMAGGKIELENTCPEHLQSLISKLNNNCCKIDVNHDKIVVVGNKTIKPIQKIDTMPYPGFPTDLQAQTMALLSIANGTSIIIENLFETRFKHAGELNKLGANIVIKDRTAVIKGVNKLFGAEVNSYDLRGGVALVLAGLVAESQTIVTNVNYIDRGYKNFEISLQKLGADVIRSK